MASAFEHKSLQWLREKFETGDVPTGYDFARLIDSCHNSLAHTDSIITGSLTVSGDITCLGTIAGTQSVSAVDPRVSELFTTVQTNSANWSLNIGDYTTHYQTLEYLYEKFQSGDTPTEQDFKVLIDNSHNTLAHQNIHLADLLTTVQTNSAYWATTGGGGGGIDDELRTLVSANSAYWGAHTDISDIVTTVSTNSASWIYGNDIPLEEIYSVVSTSSAGWSSTVSIVQNNKDKWNETRDRLDELQTYVQSNTAEWSKQTDVSQITYKVDLLETDVDTIQNTVATNSANWSSGGNLILGDLITTVDANSANWGAHTDVTDLTAAFNLLNTTVDANSANWGEQTDVTSLEELIDIALEDSTQNSLEIGTITGDLDLLNTFVQDNSSTWLESTDVEELRTIVSTNSADWPVFKTDIIELYNLIADMSLDNTGDVFTTVQTYSGMWNQKSDISSLITLISTNSAGWSTHTDLTSISATVDSKLSSLSAIIDTLSQQVEQTSYIRTIVETSSAGWGEKTDVSDIIIDLDSITSHVQTYSAGWGEKTDVTDITSDLADLTTVVQINSSDWNTTGGTDQELRTVVQTNSSDWGQHTDVTDLTADLSELTTHVATNSGTWSEGGDSTGMGTGGLGTMDPIKHHVENFYTTLPDEIVSFDAATSQEVVLRLFIVDCSGNTNFLYRNVHTTDHTSYWIWFDDTLHGDFTSSDPSGNLLSKNLKWYIDNGRARWNGSGGTSSASGVDTAVRELTAGWESTYSVVADNSASWGQSTGGGGGAVGAFVTDITCGDNSDHDNGITEPTKDTDEIPVGGKQPIVSALVDSTDVRFYLQWEGPADEWTGTPTLSGYQIPRDDTTAIGGSHARRFEGYIDLDLADFSGETTTIYYNYQGLQKSIDLEIAGGGPEIMKIEFTSTPQHGQDHYKDGDTIEFVVEFNTTDVVSYSLQGSNDTATLGYNDVTVSMNGVSATITAVCDTSVTSITDLPVRIKGRNALGTETPDWFESTDTVPVLNGPVITNVVFGAYPGTQTELKDNDTVDATFTFDTTNVNEIRLSSSNNYASSNQAISVTPTGNQATGTITIDTNVANNNGGEMQSIRARARHTTQQYGNWHVSTNKLRVNNQKPTFSAPTITYPDSQQAIKSGDDATVNIVVSNQGQSPTYMYTGNGRSELSIPDTSTYTQDKTVSWSGGTYNITAPNYKLEVNRQENDNSDSITTTVFVANVNPEIDVTIHILPGNPNAGSQPARLQSGGNDGTDVAAYEVRVTSNQKLQSFSMDVATSSNNAGTWAYGSSWTTTNNTVWKRNIKVDDEHDKGTFNWESLSLENYSGMSKTSFTNTDTGEEYVLGGFVSRDITLKKTQNEAEMNVLYETYNKVQLSWSASNSVNKRLAFGTQPGDGITDSWCLDDQSAGEAPGGPVTIRILDLSKTNAATIADTTITIEETA